MENPDIQVSGKVFENTPKEIVEKEVKKPSKMPKGKKSGSKSSKTKNTDSKTKSPKGRKGKKGEKSAGRRSMAVASLPQREAEMLDETAMFNLFYIAHDVPHALEIRGFKWPDGGKKKKGKKGK